jgi:4-hydroxyproline epimerase
VFEGRVAVKDGQVMPYVKGAAFVNSDAWLVLDELDPFCWGIR